MISYITNQLNKHNVSQPVGICILLIIGFGLPLTAMIVVTPIVIQMLKGW